MIQLLQRCNYSSCNGIAWALTSGVRFCLQKAQWEVFPMTVGQNATSAEAVFTLSGVTTQHCSPLPEHFIHLKSAQRGMCSTCAKLLKWQHLSKLEPMQMYFPTF